MDSGELDFYQHDKVCSNTCRSTKIDLSGARVSLSSPTSTEYIPLTPAAADGRYKRLPVSQATAAVVTSPLWVPFILSVFQEHSFHRGPTVLGQPLLISFLKAHLETCWVC